MSCVCKSHQFALSVEPSRGFRYFAATEPSSFRSGKR